MGIEEVWKAHLQMFCNEWVDRNTDMTFKTDERDRAIFMRKKELLKERQAQIVKAKAYAKPIRFIKKDKISCVDYRVHMQLLVKQKEHFYVEEYIDNRQADMDDQKIIYDRLLLGSDVSSQRDHDEMGLRIQPVSLVNFRRYNRLEAVKYADRYWEHPNPHFKTFEVDCTNYISQCVLAGGIPMTGQKIRGKGWWYTGDSWSYSWAVANAFRWYLSEEKNTMGAVQVEQPDQLIPGDVICYDFEGDGKWDHSTIVTAKDAHGMPLVNARTVSSKHRYWSYEDSYAYTEKTVYRFFHIGERYPLS